MERKEKACGRRRRGISGSVTVEAAYVTPCVIVVFILCLLCGMVWHDKAILEADAWRLAAGGQRWTLENQADGGGVDWRLFGRKGLLWRIAGESAPEEKICALAGDDIRGKLLVFSQVEWTADASAKETVIEYRGSGRLGGITGGLPGFGTVSGRAKVSGTEQEEWVRIARGLVTENGLFQEQEG